MQDIFPEVQQIIAEALVVDIGDVTRGANLMQDLRAESIDLLDITYRLEKAFAVELSPESIARETRGDLADEEFQQDGFLQVKAIDRLRMLMPEADPELLRAGLRVREIPTLFTVATFERLVREQLEPVASAADRRHELLPKRAQHRLAIELRV